MGFAWLFRRRRRPAPPLEADPAEELKRKLAESRPEEPPAEPPPPPRAEPALEERRRDVHGRAREAIERMRGEPPPE